MESNGYLFLRNPLRAVVRYLALASVLLMQSALLVVLDTAWAEDVDVIQGKELVLYSDTFFQGGLSSYVEKGAPLFSGPSRLATSHPGGLYVVDAGMSEFSSSTTSLSVRVSKEALRARCHEIEALNPEYRCGVNYIYHAAKTPNDPLFTQANQWGNFKIGLSSAWDTATGSSSVSVGIVDTGVETSHQDLSQNIAVNTAELNGVVSVDDDGNGYVDDVYGWNFVQNNNTVTPTGADEGHGTHVAGIVGAVGNNGVGISGVNWAVGLIVARSLGADGKGTLDQVAAGVEYAIRRGAKVVNLSLGGPDGDPLLEGVINTANSMGVLVVAAAGNESQNLNLVPSYPASYKSTNLISVAASKSDDSLASFSNFGLSTVHLAAPGDDIGSTYIGGKYVYMSGTSMAAPYVSGVAALLKGAAPSKTMLEIKDLILNNVDSVGALTPYVISGGRLNAAKAMAGFSTNPVPGPTTTPTPVRTPQPTASAPSGGIFDPTNPGSGNGAGDVSALRITLRLRKLDSRSYQMTGNIYNQLSGSGYVGTQVTLICANKVVKKVKSKTLGGLAFGKFSKAAKAKVCQAINGSIKSNRLRIPAKTK